MTQISAVVTEQKEAKRHYVQRNIFNFDALIKTNFPITQSKCLDLGNQFWEISFLQNQLIDDSVLNITFHFCVGFINCSQIYIFWNTV